MSFRWDPMTGEWVAIASEKRARYTRGGARGSLPELGERRCPFCPGHEADTEETLARVPADGPWRVRVVPNRFPLVDADAVSPSPGPWPTRPLRGTQEVVIETPDHDADLDGLAIDHVADVLSVCRDRARIVAALDGVESVVLFRNRGRRSGSSQPHPHTQLLGIPVISDAARRRWQLAEAHAADNGTTLLADVLRREREDGSRIVAETDGFVVLCPYASHHGFQTWIVPTIASGTFLDATDGVLLALAAVLRDVVGRLRSATGGADYNILFRMPLPDTARDAAFWYLDLSPRGLTGGAGFELSTGIDIVNVAPEHAARVLSEAGTGRGP